MKTLGFLFASMLALSTAAAFPMAASADPGSTTAASAVEAAFGCPGARLLRHPERCRMVGAHGELAELAGRGIYPAKALPTVSMDFSLGYVPFDYLKVGDGGTPLFPSEEAAASASGAFGQFDPGLVYLSYYREIQAPEGVLFQTESGYVRGDNVARISSLPTFQGLAFYRMPTVSFGWINSGGACSRPAAGATGVGSVRCFTRYTVVAVYESLEVEGVEWDRIGLNEWIESGFVAKVTPDPARPEGVDGDRWISVNLHEQTIGAYDQGRLVYATVASTGRYGFWTQPGTFQVWAKLERDHMTGGIATPDGSNFYRLEDVPWVLYFDQARALHGTYWHNKFGATTSRGCVNLTPADAHWFFKFADEGTWVHVWDPSGETPTDPALYGSGGA